MSEKDFEIVCARIDEERFYLNSVSQNIWKKPEVRFEEVYAHGILTTALRKYGFQVEEKYLLPTAFKAQYSSGSGPTIAIFLEYDALPGIGHACGHNLIAEAGLAAAMAVKAAMESDPSIKGKVIVLGSPAEESGGGKILMIKKGALEGIEAAMMVHPTNITLFNAPFLNRLSFKVDFEGRAAHASSVPWEGINALDAAVSCYQSVGLMRQQVRPTCRIHAIITKGGDAPNVIPAESSLLLFIRAPSRRDLDTLKPKIKRCVEGAATATGCTHNIVEDSENQYDNLITNKTLCELYSKYSTRLGEKEADLSKVSSVPVGSTDMGNVSYIVPSFHSMYKIDDKANNHTKEFTKVAGSEDAQPPTLVAAKAMAMTVLSLMRDPKLLQKAKEQFEEDLKRNK